MDTEGLVARFSCGVVVGHHYIIRLTSKSLEVGRSHSKNLPHLRQFVNH